MRLKQLFVVTYIVSISASTLIQASEFRSTRHTDSRNTPKLEFPKGSSATSSTADAYLQAEAVRYGLPPDLSNLSVKRVRQSLVGTHTRFQQMLNGIPVDGGEIIVSQRNSDGTIYQVYNNTYPVTEPTPLSKKIISKDTALLKAWNHLRVHGALKNLPESQLLYMPEKSGFRLIYKIIISVDGPNGYWENKVDAITGEVISVRRHEINSKYAAHEVPDFTAYDGPVLSLENELARVKQKSAKDDATGGAVSTVDGTALVFDPDPRTTLMNDALLDTSPAATFDPAYFTRTLRDITLDGSVYKLEGPWVTITALNGADTQPNTAPSTSLTGNWTSKRGSNAFNDVMCYFHIDQNQRYLQSIGYSNATAIQAVSIEVDTDAANGDDNSFYLPGNNQLYFGHGGVDDNEDADVILHEYGHAITFDINPNFSGGDSGAIGEGFGDYWAVSYSLTTSNGATHHPEWAFSWDAHGPDTWSGRFMDMTNLTYDHSRTYIDHETIDGIPNYSDQLWGTPIYMAHQDLLAQGRPREEIDRIILESFFSVGSGVKMRDLANSTVAAATALYPTGQHANVFYRRFSDQLILELAPPVLTYPAGGETLTNGSTIHVQWDRNGAASAAGAVIEYTDQLISAPPVFFSDDVESGTNGWVASSTGASTDWYITSTDSHSPTRSWFATDDTDIGDQFLTRSSIAISNGAILSFWHNYDLEQPYDGAVVEISTNGTTWDDLGVNATLNGYNSTIDTDYGNPISGRSAFSGSSGGFINTIIPLSAYAGQTVSIRFRESDDSSEADTGWWIDDISIESDVSSWIPLAETAAGASNYVWILPGTPGTNYGIRVRHAISNGASTTWSTSDAFTLVPGPANQAPTNIFMTGSNVIENLPAGTMIGYFTAQDPDAGESFTYALTNGPGGADNASFSINQSNLMTATTFNYEVQSNFSIRVQAKDAQGLSTQRVFTVTVTDIDEVPVLDATMALTTNDNIILTWNSAATHLYSVEYSTNLMEGFTVLQSNILATPDINAYTDSIPVLPEFYWRVITTP